jgi:hypothetical protein
MVRNRKPPHLARVPGLSEAEAPAPDPAPRRAPTEAEIGASIVGEDELKRLGRWGGAPSPKRGLLGG